MKYDPMNNMLVNEVKTKDADNMISSKEHYKDLEKVKKYAKGIEIYVLPWYGGPHPGFGISCYSPSNIATVPEIKKFINDLNGAIKEVERLDKKYKGKNLDYDK